MVLAKYYKANFIETDAVSKHKSVNRGGGFGHTGFQISQIEIYIIFSKKSVRLLEWDKE